LRCGTAVAGAKTDSAQDPSASAFLAAAAATAPPSASAADVGSASPARATASAPTEHSIVKVLAAPSASANRVESPAATQSEQIGQRVGTHGKILAISAVAKFAIAGTLAIGIVAGGIYVFGSLRARVGEKNNSVAAPSVGGETIRSAPASAVSAQVQANLSQPKEAAISPTSVAPHPELSIKLTEIMRAAAAGDWNRVRDQSQGVAVVHGDRRRARAANTEGIKALNVSDYATAVQYFRTGSEADPGDIEIRNNLGYARLKAGNPSGAMQTLNDLLGLVPDRTSAWANLSESLATIGDSDGGKVCMRVAVFFSANREKTVNFLRQTAETHSNLEFRKIAVDVLESIASIPDTAVQMPPAQVGGSQARTRGESSADGGLRKQQIEQRRKLEEAAQRERMTAEAADQSKRREEAMIAGIIGEGERCFAEKKFDCSISSANAALRIAQYDSRALSLRQRALAEQRRALQGIRIE